MNKKTKKKVSMIAAAAMTGLLAGSANQLFASTSAPVPPERPARVNRPSATSTKADASILGQRVTSQSPKQLGCGGKDGCGGKHDCKGKNECKGQGGCKSGDNGCKGKNSCKGKGGCNMKGDEGHDDEGHEGQEHE